MGDINKNETDYEKYQKHNILVSWLHSYRYKHIIKEFEKLSALKDGVLLKW